MRGHGITHTCELDGREHRRSRKDENVDWPQIESRPFITLLLGLAPFRHPSRATVSFLLLLLLLLSPPPPPPPCSYGCCAIKSPALTRASRASAGVLACSIAKQKSERFPDTHLPPPSSLCRLDRARSFSARLKIGLLPSSNRFSCRNLHWRAVFTRGRDPRAADRYPHRAMPRKPKAKATAALPEHNSRVSRPAPRGRIIVRPVFAPLGGSHRFTGV